MFAGYNDIGPSSSVEVFPEPRGINGLMCLRIEPIPAQDMVPCASDENVCKEIGQSLLLCLYLFEIILEIGRVDRQICAVFLMKELYLVVDIPGALVAGCSGKKATCFPSAQEPLHDLVTLCIRITEVMALIKQQEISVFESHIFKEHIHALLVIFPQVSHRKDTGIQLIYLIVPFPHFYKRCRTYDQRPCVVRSLKMLHDSSADIGFTEAYNIRYKDPTIVSYDLHCLSDSHLLEISEPRYDLIIPEYVHIVFAFQPILYKII
ncbi:MAG: hypothetical protein BWX92_03587 [Deltaproteobacteria bacterium ADurb.Bin135]|nr:MAG: hypothetical protein BWX92_03587 [Deltaproteobacteria bacterium ADurb.Bin135]